MTTLARIEPSIDGLEAALLESNLAKMPPDQRIMYYKRVCESVGLNPLTQPFEYITLNGKLVLYARRACTDQLRKIHNVSVTIVSRETVNETYVVTARATMADGRTDESIGAVPLKGLSGEALSNQLMKGETKAKRRVTLSICGLSMLDETETDSVPAQRVDVAPRQSTEAKLEAIAAQGGNLTSEAAVRAAQGGERAASPLSAAGTSSPGTQTVARPRGGEPVPAGDLATLAVSELAQTAQAAETSEDTGEVESVWVKRNNTLALAAYELSGIGNKGMNQLGLVEPSIPCPSFSAKAKQFAGLSYDNPKVAGYLREKVIPDPAFATKPIAVQVWATFAVAMHEVKKQLGINEETDNGTHEA